MTTREMLELAAKAAGYEVLDWYGERYTTTDGDRLFPWNPLADDGDALRLAVKLGMLLTLPKYKGFGTSAEPQGDGAVGVTSFREDPELQTREAIVRAAAEIGRAMG